MTDQPLDLDAILARAAAATPGPWGTQRDLAGAYTVQARPRTTRYGMENDGDIATLAADRTDAENYANARFIAHAPADVKAMAAEIRCLRAELAAAHARLDATARLAGRQETKLRAIGAPGTVDALTVTVQDSSRLAVQLPPAEGPEYTPCTTCDHIEPDHRPDAGPCLECDCGAYQPAARP
jgi:4-hydroxyphenylpyruvate dioxygenase-like putative hemolysin